MPPTTHSPSRSPGRPPRSLRALARRARPAASSNARRLSATTLNRRTATSSSLGREDRTLALAAGERLTAAGRRAFWRGDHRTASGLLRRGLALLRPHTLDLHAEIELAYATFWTDRARALEIAETAAARADALGDEAGGATGHAVAAEFRLSGGQGSVDDLERLARNALPLLESAEDHDGLYAVWECLGTVASARSRYEDWAHAKEQSVSHARLAGHRGGRSSRLRFRW